MRSYLNCPKADLTRRIAAGLPAIALACLLGMVPAAFANGITPPPTPPAITPPSGNTAFLMGHAIGTQGYVCLPLGTGASWTVNSSRPQATLFFTLFGTFSQQILTHFLSPDTNPTSLPRTRSHLAAQPGKAPSTAAPSGATSWPQLTPALTPAAPLRVRFHACYSRRLDPRPGPRAGSR